MRKENTYDPLTATVQEFVACYSTQVAWQALMAEENRKRALETLFKTLLHHLMTAKIRVPRTMVEGFASHEEG